MAGVGGTKQRRGTPEGPSPGLGRTLSGHAYDTGQEGTAPHPHRAQNSAAGTENSHSEWFKGHAGAEEWQSVC